MVRVSLLRRVRTIAVAIVAVAGLAAMPRPAAAQDAAGFIANLGNQATQVLGPSVPPAQRAAQFQRIFTNDFDLQGAARFVMGPYWHRLTAEQQQQFLPLFGDYLAHAYAARLGQYAGAPFRVTGSRPNGDETIVTSQVIRSGGKPIEMDWHVANRGGRFLVEDVYVDGVSMKVTHRQEFAGIIQRNGGQPTAVFAALRQQMEQAAPQVGSSHPAAAYQYQAAPAAPYQAGPANQYEPAPAYGR
jgi:phospholipid transport system substrate-binding protein